MKKRFIVPALALVLIALLTACQLKTVEPFQFGMQGGRGNLVRGGGEAAERVVPIPGGAEAYTLRVSGLSFSADQGKFAVDLVIDESLAREVRLTVDSNIAEFISVHCGEDGVITVKTEEQRLLAPTRLRLVVGAPVGRLILNGPWNFTYDCPSVEDCTIEINGAANGSLVFGALSRLEAVLNGACSLTLRGTAKQAVFTVNGASRVEAFGLIAGTAAVTINGAGSCEVTARETLDAEINGVGSITYDGSPEVRRAVRGLGEIKAR